MKFKVEAKMISGMVIPYITRGFSIMLLEDGRISVTLNEGYVFICKDIKVTTVNEEENNG